MKTDYCIDTPWQGLQELKSGLEWKRPKLWRGGSVLSSQWLIGLAVNSFQKWDFSKWKEPVIPVLSENYCSGIM